MYEGYTKVYEGVRRCTKVYEGVRSIRRCTKVYEGVRSIRRCTKVYDVYDRMPRLVRLELEAWRRLVRPPSPTFAHLRPSGVRSYTFAYHRPP